MSLFNALSRAASAYTQDLVKDFQRFKNRASLESLMAAYALVAAADGYVSADERRKVVSLIQSSPVFGVFDIDTAVILFNKYAATFQVDPQIARMNVFQALNRSRGDAEMNRTIIRLCAMLAQSPEEKEAVRSICIELNERPQSFPELGVSQEPLRRRPDQSTWFPDEHTRRIAEDARRNESYHCPAPTSGFTAKGLKDFFDE